MKYTCTIEIDLPLDRVVELWNDENYFNKWQDGFQSINLINGEPGAVGTKSLIKIQQGNRKMELIETILINNLPEEKKALYEHIHMNNTQSTKFKKISETETRYISEVEYTEFKSFIPKMMAKLFPKIFKKQSEKWMNQFKGFVENM